MRLPNPIAGDATVTRRAGFLVLAALLPALAHAQPASAQPAPAPLTAPSSSGNPNLAIATVKLENGTRVSKIIGSTVYADANTSIGTVDDLVMTEDAHIVMAVVSVGGFLGMGSKLVAIPYAQLKFDGGRTMLPGATKDSLNGMPNFTF